MLKDRQEGVGEDPIFLLEKMSTEKQFPTLSDTRQPSWLSNVAAKSHLRFSTLEKPKQNWAHPRTRIDVEKNMRKKCLSKVENYEWDRQLGSKMGEINEIDGCVYACKSNIKNGKKMSRSTI